MAGSRVKNKAAQAERARATRRRVVEAATALFVENGYVQTTMADIARKAGVAVQTLYLSFGSKVAVLAAALDVAIVGDDEAVPVLERPWVESLREQSDGIGALNAIIDATAEITVRVYPLWAAMSAAAADPEVGALLAEDSRRRFHTMSVTMADIAGRFPLAPGMSVERATQILNATISLQTYGVLVMEHSWSVPDWRDFAGRAIRAEILPGHR